MVNHLFNMNKVMENSFIDKNLVGYLKTKLFYCLLVFILCLNLSQSDSSFYQPYPQSQRQQQHQQHKQSQQNQYRNHHHHHYPHHSRRNDHTVDMEDPWGYEAIRWIHNSIDDDQDGSIDRKESSKFISTDLKLTDDADERKESLHGDDGTISVDEMWEAWKKSDIAKWTVDETVNWLSGIVKLPQYKENFIENHIDGSRLPRIAANPSFVTNVLKITDPLDRQRLVLEAMQAVLFGVPKSRLIADRYLAVLLFIIITTFWFVFNQRRSVQSRLDEVFRQMTTLQESRDKLLSIQGELEKAKEGNKILTSEADHLQEILKAAEAASASTSNSVTVSTGSSSASSTENSSFPVSQQQSSNYQRSLSKETAHPAISLKEREAELLEEIEATRKRLTHVEQMLAQTDVERVQYQKAQLQHWLRITYEIENKNFSDEKGTVEAEMIKSQLQLKRKRSNRSPSTRQSGYEESSRASRVKLTELINQIESSRDKWMSIENLCGFSIRDNPGLNVLKSQMKHANSYNRISNTDEGDTIDYEEDNWASNNHSPPDSGLSFSMDHPFPVRKTSWQESNDHLAIRKISTMSYHHIPLLMLPAIESSSRSLRNSSLFIDRDNSLEPDSKESDRRLLKLNNGSCEGLLNLSQSYNSSLLQRRLTKRLGSYPDNLARLPEHSSILEAPMHRSGRRSAEI